MKLSIIVAMSKNRIIGRGGQLPWRLPADLRRFKQLTMGHPLIMGRKTFDSIGKPLPGRTSIVVTRQADFHVPGVLTATNFPEAIRLAEERSDEAFVIGGGEIYSHALPLAHRLYVTAVEADLDGDTLFPDWDARQWQIVEDTTHPADTQNSFAMHFQVFDRIRNDDESGATAGLPSSAGSW
jgi:dihydrofolate reductase